MQQANPDIKIHFQAGTSIHEQTLVQAELIIIVNPERIEQHKQELASRGLPAFDYSANNHYLIELECNPGAEKDLYSQVLKDIEEHQYETLFGHIVSSIANRYSTLNAYESQGRVYVHFSKDNQASNDGNAPQEEQNSENVSEASQQQAAPESKKQHARSALGKLKHDVKMSLAAEGGFRRTSENGTPTGLGISFLDLKCEYPSGKEVGQLVVKLLKDIKKQHPMFSVLPSLKKAHLEIKVPSIQTIAEEIEVRIRDPEVRGVVFREGKQLMQNRFSFTMFDRWAKCMIKVSVRLEQMELLLGLYMNYVVSYVRDILH